MSRKQSASILESLEDLRGLERRYRGTPNEVRLRLLCLRKESPFLTFPAIAEVLGYSEPTVKRWWNAYLRGGVDGLLAQRGVKRVGKGEREMEELRRKILGNAFTGLDDVRQWLESVPKSESAADTPQEAGPFQAPVPEHPERSGPPDREESIERKNGRGGDFSDALITFLNALPTTGSVVDWIEKFRTALIHLLSDVDRIMISVNQECDLRRPGSYRPGLYFTQNIAGKETEDYIGVSTDGAQPPRDRFLGILRKQGFPFEAYHPPVIFAYYFQVSAYLGTIFLWRDRSRPAISSGTLQLMDRLRPFMEFMLSDCVTRHRFNEPIDNAFNNALEQLSHDFDLSPQERRVLMLRLVGQTYDQIADSISISVDTVGFHLKSIYRKTGSRGISELFGRYFTPLVTPPSHD